MIRLTRCTQADKAGTYFRLHLAAGDSQAQPSSSPVALQARWIGPALSEVALVRDNQPKAKELVRLCRGLHPSKQVRLAPSINRKRAYYDLTITAPKTVSLAALLLPNHLTARAVMRAHLEAVGEVAAKVGTLLQPQSRLAPGVAAWLGATFHHTHTREGDPHLHSHLILPNLMRNTKGAWRAMQVNIAGLNHTHLDLIYCHALTRNLRRAGFRRGELWMDHDGHTELRPLLSLAARFSQARQQLLAAAGRSEAKRPIIGAQAGEYVEVHRRSTLPVPANRPALRRRARLADQLRRPKPKDADDPVRLSDEASRWRQALENQELGSLMRLLDELDQSNPRRRLLPKKQLPPAAAWIVRTAFASVCARRQMDPTEGLLLRAAVAYSAGRHPYEELQAACTTRLEEHRVAVAAVWARIYADQRAMEEAAYDRLAYTRVTAPTAPRPAVSRSAPSSLR